MRFFLDTNVIIDLIDNDRAENQSAAMILQLAADNPGKVSLFTTEDSISTAAYVMRHDVKTFGLKIASLLKYVDILPIGREMLLDVGARSHPDYEDSMHIECAEFHNCCCIITRDRAHYAGYTSLRVYSPREFLEIL